MAAGLPGFHLQMKTTWPAARVRWKPDGGSWEGVLGSLERRPRALSSRPLPGLSGLRGVVCDPASLPCAQTGLGCGVLLPGPQPAQKM